MTIFAMALALMLPAIPGLSSWLGFTSLSFMQYLIVGSVALSYIVILEITKKWFYRVSKETS
jgi:hypothetical protein